MKSTNEQITKYLFTLYSIHGKITTDRDDLIDLIESYNLIQYTIKKHIRNEINT
jgi:hypothetical protein